MIIFYQLIPLKFEDILPQLAWLINQPHQFKTVVIDSVTALERMAIDYVIAMDDKKPKSINQAMGGYGAGFSAVAGLHQRVRTAAKRLNEKGINVVFLAHCDTETLDLPDSEPYQRWVLRMNKKSVAPYVDDVDLVGFIKLRTVTIGDDDRKKAVSDGTRVLVTYATAANISKNRFGISADLVVEAGKNPLLKYIPSLSKPTPPVVVEPQPQSTVEEPTATDEGESS